MVVTSILGTKVTFQQIEVMLPTDSLIMSVCKCSRKTDLRQLSACMIVRSIDTVQNHTRAPTVYLCPHSSHYTDEKSLFIFNYVTGNNIPSFANEQASGIIWNSCPGSSRSFFLIQCLSRWCVDIGKFLNHWPTLLLLLLSFDFFYVSFDRIDPEDIFQDVHDNHKQANANEEKNGNVSERLSYHATDNQCCSHQLTMSTGKVAAKTLARVVQ